MKTSYHRPIQIPQIEGNIHVIEFGTWVCLEKNTYRSLVTSNLLFQHSIHSDSNKVIVEHTKTNGSR